METVTRAGRIATATATVLDDVLREGARAMLQRAIEQEVAQYVEAHRRCLDGDGHRLVVRNGHLPARRVLTGLGPLEVRQPRVNDRRVDPASGERFRFTSKILPPYLRRAGSVEQLVPWLYLKGVSSSDFPEALSALGHDGSGLSATNVVRMKELWREEWSEWSRRSLLGKRYVYLWADGIYFNIRLADEGEGRQCVLVVMGATEDGAKELVAIREGHRESERSWLELLRDLRDRGLEGDPRLAVGDGALGFWKALPQVFPTTRWQRCCIHKACNVLNHFPRSRQPAANAKLQDVWMAATRADALAALERFARDHRAKYPKAVECLLKDKDELLAFYDFPAEHWAHLRTTNPIESTFATVRLRTAKTKGCGSRQACLTMVFKLCESAQKNWRKLNGCALLKEVSSGVEFVDGIRKAA
ncbi:MAG: IS256 family transposase [Actinobacteria bacterium]|nr:IS256 family transposase [Actinomycetota bacterium]